MGCTHLLCVTANLFFSVNCCVTVLMTMFCHCIAQHTRVPLTKHVQDFRVCVPYICVKDCPPRVVFEKA